MRITFACACLAVSVYAPVAWGQADTARVAFVRREVEIQSASAHPAQVGDVLAAGDRVRTGADATALIALADGATLRLGPNSQVVMFAAPTRPPPGAPPSTDTTLVRGAVTLRTPAAAAHHPPLATPSARVTLLRGEALVEVGAGRVTRLAVTEGRARVRAGTTEALVREGTGMRIESAGSLGQPVPLLAPPRWAEALPASVFAGSVPVEVRGSVATASVAGRASSPSPGAPQLAQWHVRVVREDAPDNVVDELVLPSTAPAVALSLTELGTYLVRVAAVSADHFEGRAGAPVRVQVVGPRIVPASAGHRAVVEMPAGFFCGLDGGALAPAGRAMELAPLRAHRLRCGARRDGADALESVIPADRAGPLLHTVHVGPGGFQPTSSVQVLTVHLTDAMGVPVANASVRVAASAGASVQPLVETENRGEYAALIAWRPATAGLRLRFTVDGIESFDEVYGTPPVEP